jgi:uncharacterized protein (TIGR03000 family)
MYSVVLLMAITTGGESADGCRGCRGGGCGCYCGGCYCGGGYCGGCNAGRGCRRGCRGGCNGCYSYGCYSCGGGCYSYGCHSSYGCGGCYAGYSGCYGGGYAGCGGYASYSGCHAGAYAAAPVSYGCVASAHVSAGCAAGHVVGSRVIDGGMAVASSNVVTDASTATIVVSVPANAKVTIDGQATVSTTATRYFQTPSLTAGKPYAYTVEASFVKDGAPVKVSKKVSFQAGDTVRCDLTSDTAVASR